MMMSEEVEAAERIRAQRELVATLRDALRGLLDWVEEGCPDGGRYSIVEARAALAGVSLVQTATTK